jgi:hypothetical protein
VFSGLVNLKEINLQRNKMTSIHPDTFLGLPNLQKLLLGYNPTLTIPTDRNLINSLTLSYLGIPESSISSLSVETFANASALVKIDLSDNNLGTVDINMLRALPRLSSISLYGNPLQCDCQLQEVWRWCEDRNIQTAYRGTTPECDTPSEVKGIWWGVLEKGKCLQGNIEYYGDYNSTRYNYTDTEINYYQKYGVNTYKQYQLPLYAFSFIFGTISNVILLIIIISNKDMRTVPNMYLINLAISDIISLTVLFSEACANKISGTWLYGDFLCTFVPFCRRLSVGLSAYSVAVYSFQRYRVIVNSLQVRISSPPKWRVIVAIIFGLWIVAALFAVPSAVSKYLCEGYFISKSKNYYHFVVIFELLVSCLLPLCVVAFSYVMTARHLFENSRAISDGAQNPQLKTRRKTAKTVVGLAFVFMISYVPYHAFWTYLVYEKEYFLFYIPFLLNLNYKFQFTYLISNGFLLINSCLNPVALFFTSSHFKQHLKSYFTCFCKTNSPPTDFQLERRK